MRTSIKWHWDQGRLSYFQFENIKSIAHCLNLLEGVQINSKEGDGLRDVLEANTGLPFSPKHYRVWRNYKRVFECSLLATSVNNNLVISDFCRRLIEKGDASMEIDEYLWALIQRFRFPFPAFKDYQRSGYHVYPFIAILKFLLSSFNRGKIASMSIDDLFELIVANNCTGLEDIDHYSKLIRKSYRPKGDELRQVREMLIFISQLSILKWSKGHLFLDISQKDFQDYKAFKDQLKPVNNEAKALPSEEFLSLSTIKSKTDFPLVLHSREVPTDTLFIEGKRSRVTHIKIERSPLLRKLFFTKYPSTACNMCVCETKDRYPWTDNILEVHHLLPLSSALHVTSKGTSLEDVVALCPNCHKSVHVYYKNWLNNYKVEDFRNRDEAKEVYSLAKNSIRL